MSLWTPGGEHPVDRPGPEAVAEPVPEVEPELSPEEQAQLDEMRAQMQEVQAQLLSVPAAVVVVNHAMGLYELAALHLMQPEPNLSDASVAIDALSALLDGMVGRLGPDEDAVREALGQLKGAYLEIRARRQGDSGQAAT